MSNLLQMAGSIAISFAMLNSAAAHPHVLVAARAELIMKNNEVTAIREVWTFDEMYTAFAITGFGKTAQLPTSEELKEVAKQNIDDLSEVGFFTDLRGDHGTAAFEKPTVYEAHVIKPGEEEQLQLTFLLPLKSPIAMHHGTLRVYDPSYFTAFSFEEREPVKMVGATNCSIERSKPSALAAIDQMALKESFFTNMLPGTDFGSKMAEALHVTCLR